MTDSSNHKYIHYQRALWGSFLLLISLVHTGVKASDEDIAQEQEVDIEVFQQQLEQQQIKIEALEQEINILKIEKTEYEKEIADLKQEKEDISLAYDDLKKENQSCADQNPNLVGRTHVKVLKHLKFDVNTIPPGIFFGNCRLCVRRSICFFF